MKVMVISCVMIWIQYCSSTANRGDKQSPISGSKTKSASTITEDKKAKEQKPLINLKVQSSQPAEILTANRGDKHCRTRPRDEQSPIGGSKTMPTSTVTEEDKKVEEGKPLINLKIHSQGKADVFFRIRINSPLKRLMVAYCNSQSVEPFTYEFLFNGAFINPEKTPHDLGMQDGDEIEAWLHVHGGGRHK